MARRGLTFLAMLNIIAGLVIVLGLMVSLARHVRHSSAEEVTRDALIRLERMMDRYRDLAAALGDVPPLISHAASDEADLEVAAVANNRAFVKACQAKYAALAFEGFPPSVYDGTMLRDGWGTPVVFMASGARNIGIEPQIRYFFLSAGPDRSFSTVLDNLYSYERSMAAAAGHAE